jgi:spore maturation protein CgeB
VKIVIFVHAIASCWNNDSSHFLRGVAAEFVRCGHDVLFCEPHHSWSESNLIRDHGAAPLDEFRAIFPSLRVAKYSTEGPDLNRLTDGAHLVLVHQWNSPSLITALGQKRRDGAPFVLFFHDTDHRDPNERTDTGDFELGDYDGVLASCSSLAEHHQRRRTARRVWVWHEAADTALFYPRATNRTEGDLVWLGGWGDAKRTAELEELMLRPIEALGLFANLYGARYPEAAVQGLAARGIAYRGWLPNHQIPEVFARHRLTVHLPARGPARSPRRLSTIRVLEALACGIPVIAGRWEDTDGLFPNDCLLVARNGQEMRNHLRAVLSDPALAQSLRESGLEIIRKQHSCRHRVQELLAICASIEKPTALAQCHSTVISDDVLFPPFAATPQPTPAVS